MEIMACFRRENRFIRKRVLDRCEDKVNVLWSGSRASLIDPVVLGPEASRHLWAVLTRAKVGDGAIEYVQIIEKLKDIHCEPLVLVDVLWQRHNCPKVALDKMCTFERRLQEKWLWQPSTRIRRYGADSNVEYFCESH